MGEKVRHRQLRNDVYQLFTRWKLPIVKYDEHLAELLDVPYGDSLRMTPKAISACEMLLTENGRTYYQRMLRRKYNE